MNVQAHLSGQVSSNQGTMSQQNGNSQIQNNLVNGGGTGLGPSRGDNDLARLRHGMRVKM